jgi:hypothetical protein
MPRGKLKPQTELERALAKVNDLFPDIDLSSAQLPAENQTDIVREAESVLAYFETSGKNFKEKQCKFCNRIFAYKWDHDGVSHCSIPCAKGSLQKIGLDWTPNKPLQERWGKTVPAIVPPQALEILKGQQENGSPKDPVLDTSLEEFG